jgi:hypothetical protein
MPTVYYDVAMRIFIDTEFTDHAHPDLISIGMVTDGGQIFYAERTDYRYENCTSFVRSEVIPLLGREPAAACTAAELSHRLYEWFRTLPEGATVFYDFETDRRLLETAFLGPLPSNLSRYELVNHKIFRHSAYKLGEVLTYSVAWPPHHALADAQALREGYLRWEAAINGRDWRSPIAPSALS